MYAKSSGYYGLPNQFHAVATMKRHLKLRELAYEFAYRVPIKNFLDHWERNASHLHGCRMVFSDQNFPDSLPAGLHNRAFGTDPQAYLNSLFSAPGLLFLSPELVHFHRYIGGAAPLQVDYSVSLDSNVVGDIHKFMHGKSLDARLPAFLEMAKYLRENKINLDANPYLFENMQKARTDQKHLDFVINGFAAFYRFTTGAPLIDEPQALSDFAFEMSESDAQSHAKADRKSVV